jgi:hypothetical protein
LPRVQRRSYRVRCTARCPSAAPAFAWRDELEISPSVRRRRARPRRLHHHLRQ